MTLFDSADGDRPAEFPKSWSARQRRNAAAGLHPHAGVENAGNGETCGTCRHSTHDDRPRGPRLSRRYHKCLLAKVTLGPDTDIRLSWAACIYWQPRR